MSNTLIRNRAMTGRLSWVALLAAGGSILVITGALLPWFSLFGGLQTYTGAEAWNGRLLLSGGVLSLVLATLYGWRGGLKLRWGIGLLGFALLAFTSWLLFQLLLTLIELEQEPLMLGSAGPGLFVVELGSYLIFSTLLIVKEERTTSRLE